MGGGPSTPTLVAAVGRAGGLGFLAAGYKSAAQVAEQIDDVERSGVVFGINLFAPNPVPVDADAFKSFAGAIGADAAAVGVDLSDVGIVEDDDDWSAKLELLVDHPVPVVSFTFGLVPPDAIRRLRRSGSVLLQTVTSVDEAVAASEAGVDALVVQASAAGAHSGTWTPGTIPPEVSLLDLLAAVRRRTSLPLVAAGGLVTAADIAEALTAGASSAMLGTALLRCDESGASATYKAALADESRTETVVTRAFTGRPARALRNSFVDRHSASAPSGYPAIHYLTRPIRAAATAAGDAERLNLWAGTGVRQTRSGPAVAILHSVSPV